ncbi:MAG: glpQ [Phenylobacterium sp.]|nr:glpQ [Phenylobacterium sp.]
MILTRRRALAAATALAAMPAAAQPKGGASKPRPIVIAHRGASGERPEHTMMGYRLAIAEGADFIEPDLVPTKDGHLVVRHENEISGATDVATHPEFAGRKATKVIDGQKIEGWFTEDFTLAELKTLRARERLPQLRPASAAFDGREAIPTYQEMIDLAKAESRRLGRTIGTYPEMKHPTYFASIGLPLEHRLLATLKANGLDSRTAPVFVQCFEVGALKTFRTLSKARLIQLVSADDGPADLPTVTYRQMITPGGLKAVAAYADGLGPEWALVVPATPEGALGPASPLVGDAHAAGLAVHPWTVRAENFFLPKALWRGTSAAGHGDVDAVYRALWASGVDGLFSDFPGLAVASRR